MAVGIAVYSDADRIALHVRLADEAYPVGPGPGARELPQRGPAHRGRRGSSNADLVHPGYGFFAENADFAQRVHRGGTRSGRPHARRDPRHGGQGRGPAGRRHGRRFPWSRAPETSRPSPRRIAALAEALGYPVLIKAAFGGGGKGMRSCANREELLRSLELARREALGAFGDATVYLEKAILRPRHIEIQILADRHGKIVHLGERECSIQRRHQKLLEESPTPSGFPGLREQMGEAAVEIARGDRLRERRHGRVPRRRTRGASTSSR